MRNIFDSIWQRFGADKDPAAALAQMQARVAELSAEEDELKHEIEACVSAQAVEDAAAVIDGGEVSTSPDPELERLRSRQRAVSAAIIRLRSKIDEVADETRRNKVASGLDAIKELHRQHHHRRAVAARLREIAADYASDRALSPIVLEAHRLAAEIQPLLPRPDDIGTVTAWTYRSGPTTDDQRHLDLSSVLAALNSVEVAWDPPATYRDALESNEERERRLDELAAAERARVEEQSRKPAGRKAGTWSHPA